MGIVARVRDRNGSVVRFPDPVQPGTSEAAGDFDRLIPTAGDEFTLLGTVDPYGESAFNPERIPDLIQEIQSLIPLAKPKAELNGLRRLERMAQLVQEGQDLSLWFDGD
jgi:hypothetical protein